MENVMHYFAGDHTAKGFYTFYRSNFQGLKSIFILKGKSKTVKTQIMKKLVATWNQKAHHVEMIHASADHHMLDGVIFPFLKTGVYDGSAGMLRTDDATTTIIDVDTAMDLASLHASKGTIDHHEKLMNQSIQSAHKSFRTGLVIHDDLEKIYIGEMDFDKANQLTEEWRKRLFTNQKPLKMKAQIKKRFFGASTPAGVFDYIPNLTKDLSKRYFIKGRAGTGKSSFLKKIANTAIDRGFDIEIYYCGFDPESLDMLVVRELGFCIFDSTDPHEYFPEHQGDEITDLYEKTVTPGTDENHASEIDPLTKQYKSYMKEGSRHLKAAKRERDQIEQLYQQVADQQLVNRMFNDISQAMEKHVDD